MTRDRHESQTDPIAVVAQSRRGMVDAVRQALSGAARRMGGLDRCNATILPQVVNDGSHEHFQIMVSVTKRNTISTF
jgi:flavin-binding protein dodecin